MNDQVQRKPDIGEKVFAHNGNKSKPVECIYVAYKKFDIRPWIVMVGGRKVKYKFVERRGKA